MTEILKVWFVFSFTLGCWTCLNLCINRKGDWRVKKAILVFVALLLISPFNAYVTLTRGSPVVWLLTIQQEITWTLGPLMVLLIQFVLLKSVRHYQYVLHAVPFTLGLAYGFFKPDWLPFPLFFSLLFAQVFGYLGYAVYLLHKHKSKIVNLAVYHKNTTYYWLLYLIIGLAFIMFLDFYIYTNVYLGFVKSFLFIALAGSIVALYVNAIALFAVYKPSVFFHEPPQIEQEDASIIKPILRSVELSSEAAMQLDEQLEQLMRNHKPHLDEDISLSKLASLLGVTPHQLSELLNVHKHTNFYDYLNHLRFNEAVLLINNIDLDISIEDVVYQSGFNNRNSFYKVFKEKTGLTPKQYKKSIA